MNKHSNNHPENIGRHTADWTVGSKRRDHTEGAYQRTGLRVSTGKRVAA